MKLFLIFIVLVMTGCSALSEKNSVKSNIESPSIATSRIKKCDKNKNVAVFKHVDKKFNKVIPIIKGETTLIVKGSIRPDLINEDSYMPSSSTKGSKYLKNKKIIINAIQRASAAGYHTDECTEQANQGFYNKVTVSLKVTRKKGYILLETLGSSGFMHHSKGFYKVSILLPRYMRYKYIKVAPKRR